MRRFGKAWLDNDFELLWAFMCLFSGLPLAIGIAPPPSSISSILPLVHRIMWGLSLSMGGGCILFGVGWRYFNAHKFIAGLYVERAGLYMLGSATMVFILVVTLFAGAPSFFIAAICGGFIAACFSRSRRIGKEIAIVREHGN